MDTYICMAESLRCSPESITTLLIAYTPIQNQKFFFKKKKRTMLSAKVLKYPKVARPDVSSIPYINIYLEEFLWVIFVTVLL